MSNFEIFEKNIFCSQIYSVHLNNIDNKKIEEESYLLKQKYNSEKMTNYGGWQSPSKWYMEDLDKTEILKLLKEIKIAVENISKKWDLEVFISNFWININGKYNFNYPHEHNSSVFSGVYYVKCNKESGNLIFERPDNQKFFIDESRDNEYRFQAYSIQPKPSQLFIFPSYLKHFVEPNLSNDDRISIAFNFVKNLDAV